MDVFRRNSPEQFGTGEGGAASPPQDPRLQPTPDYGTMGPSSDFARSQAGSALNSAAPSVPQRAPRNLRGLQLLAMAAGIVAALVASSGSGQAGWGKILGGFAAPNSSPGVASAKFSDRELDGQKPQKQAEILLTRAVSQAGGAPDHGAPDGTAADDQSGTRIGATQIEEQIQARAESWRGKLKWNPQLSQLTTAALNSGDRSVQESAIEVQLAAYGLAKSQSSVDNLVRQASSPDHAQRIWAFWALGLLGNRGVETDVVVQVLTAHLKSSQNGDDEDARRWAVEGLALVGTTPTIVPLLEAMHDDRSALVRERAACSLAESGTLSHEQRMAAVPQLINYSDDPALDEQTHGWAFQALSDITKQRLPNDSAAWRAWYQNAVVRGQ